MGLPCLTLLVVTMTIAAPAAGVGSVIAVATVVAARFMFRQYEGEQPHRGAEMRGGGGDTVAADDDASYEEEPYSPKGERWGEESRRGSGGVGAGRGGEVRGGDMERTEGLTWSTKLPREGENGENGETGHGGLEESVGSNAAVGDVEDVTSGEAKEESGGNNGPSSR